MLTPYVRENKKGNFNFIMKKIVFSLLIGVLVFQSFSQAVSIGVFYQNYLIDIPALKVRYEKEFGVGNVHINDYGLDFSISVLALQTNDIIIVNAGYVSIPTTFMNSLAALYNQNKHLIISAEGSYLDDNQTKFFASHLWNKITGQSITETKFLSGTEEPPRLHPSNGPGGLSTNVKLSGSTLSYTSFGNLNPLNVVHQREDKLPNCDNIVGLDALYPYEPTIDEGTLYITGEIYYPFLRAGTSPEVEDLLENLIILQQRILSNNDLALLSLNNWLNNPEKIFTNVYPVVNLGEDILIEPGQLITLDAGKTTLAQYKWNTMDLTQTINTDQAGIYIVDVTGPNACKTSDTVVVTEKVTIYIPTGFTPDNDGKNDILEGIVAGSADYEVKFYLFDRGGRIIYSAINEPIRWDGGNTLKPGVFVWRLEYKASYEIDWRIETGTVSLLK